MKRILLIFAVALFIGGAATAQEKTKMESSKTLVTYYSATGTTESVAKVIAEVTGGRLYEIEPKEIYTSADLNWHNQNSRSSVEMKDAKSRPALKSAMANIAEYNVIFIGYPIWWNEAPRVINSFIEAHDLSGKVIIPFATSGGSGVTNSVAILKRTYPNLDWREGRLINSSSKSGVETWLKSILNF